MASSSAESVSASRYGSATAWAGGLVAQPHLAAAVGGPTDDAGGFEGSGERERVGWGVSDALGFARQPRGLGARGRRGRDSHQLPRRLVEPVRGFGRRRRVSLATPGADEPEAPAPS